MKAENESRTIRTTASTASAHYVAPARRIDAQDLADAMARMKTAYDEFMQWLKGFDMDGDDVARIKAELPEQWVDFRTTSDEVDQAWKDGEEDLFFMALGHMKDVITEMTARVGIDAPEVVADSATGAGLEGVPAAAGTVTDA